ncbi:MAG: ABC transporter ATP-binding protein [Sediminibacterium sp.]
MSQIAIKVENLSKQYRLGTVGTGTISHDINRWWHRIRGKEDPYLKIGETNDRASKGNSEYVWALQDINFEVQQGEVLGIIGRNGAGKSTLLKILSRTTAPTTGSIKIKGRVASLLEVGTGFHPELTGRENIYLNGAILGMTKAEISRKFDEIVDFAGVERYVDTPVKRYSSGMYVRLAFAVAAHLEPEILIVDEVLAVGDAEFQKKALGKMQEVSQGQGRTVLFVSHNMLAIKNICHTALALEKGRILKKGSVESIINNYLKNDKKISKDRKYYNGEGILSEWIELVEVKIDSDKDTITRNDKIVIRVFFRHKLVKPFFVNLIIRHISGDVVFEAPSNIFEIPIGEAEVSFTIPELLLNTDVYTVQVNFTTSDIRIVGYARDILEFEIEEDIFVKDYFGKAAGYFRPTIPSSIKVK